MNAVAITARFITRTSNGYTINLQNNSIVNERSTEEVLGLLPGLFTRKGITINGKEGNRIFINGREVKDLKELNALPADHIDKIEVIYIRKCI